eukprot:GHVL01019668.1.p1 GENE.GHVL01019668.1~~GHVL01019668.1.p1  ORF type:complete len:491 (+),score=124.59 GHVL01019668.1:139-1473(+)
MVEEVKKFDRYNNGLVTASSLSRCLEALGVEYGSQEANVVMRYVTILPDGLVSVKDLMLAARPEQPPASKTTPGIVCPVEDKSTSDLDTQESLRRAYEMWDKGKYNTEVFKKRIQSCGYPLTNEFERLLILNGPGGSIPFNKIYQALSIDQTQGRKMRMPPPEVADSFKIAKPDASTDLITWRKAPGDAIPRSAYSDESEEAIHKCICDYLDGNISVIKFRSQLSERFNIKISPEIALLIRQHESDNSGHFRDFARVILCQRQLKQSETAVTGRNDAAGTRDDSCGHSILAENGFVTAISHEGAERNRGKGFHGCTPKDAGDIITWKGGGMQEPQSCPNRPYTAPKGHEDIIGWKSTDNNKTDDSGFRRYESLGGESLRVGSRGESIDISNRRFENSYSNVFEKKSDVKSSHRGGVGLQFENSGDIITWSTNQKSENTQKGKKL